MIPRRVLSGRFKDAFGGCLIFEEAGGHLRPRESSSIGQNEEESTSTRASVGQLRRAD